MTDAILHAVDLEDLNYPCLTYAMRRIGTEKLPSTFTAGELPYRGEQNVGDVLVWHIDDASHDYASDYIGQHGPVTGYVKYDRHYAVYEGDDLVSDTDALGDMSLINIRLRRLSRLKSRPDGIIPYEKEATNG